MYGSSAAVIGYGLEKLGRPAQLFAAEKVWTWLQSGGPGQMEEQRALWGVERFDLMQVHDLLSWEGHLETLKQRSEEHTSELQSLMRISYAVFCLKKKNSIKQQQQST